MKLSALDVVQFVCKWMGIDPGEPMDEATTTIFRQRWRAINELLGDVRL